MEEYPAALLFYFFLKKGRGSKTRTWITRTKVNNLHHLAKQTDEWIWSELYVVCVRGLSKHKKNSETKTFLHFCSLF